MKIRIPTDWLSQHYQAFTTAALLVSIASAILVDHLPSNSVAFLAVCAGTACVELAAAVATICVQRQNRA